MNYAKPEILVTGEAVSVIQGGKHGLPMDSLETTTPMPMTRMSSCVGALRTQRPDAFPPRTPRNRGSRLPLRVFWERLLQRRSLAQDCEIDGYNPRECLIITGARFVRAPAKMDDDFLRACSLPRFQSLAWCERD